MCKFPCLNIDVNVGVPLATLNTANCVSESCKNSKAKNVIWNCKDAENIIQLQLNKETVQRTWLSMHMNVV